MIKHKLLPNKALSPEPPPGPLAALLRGAPSEDSLDGLSHDICSPAPIAAASTPGSSQKPSDLNSRRLDMERAETELSLLNEISRVLGSTLDLHAVFEQTM